MNSFDKQPVAHSGAVAVRNCYLTTHQSDTDLRPSEDNTTKKHAWCGSIGLLSATWLYAVSIHCANQTPLVLTVGHIDFEVCFANVMLLMFISLARLDLVIMGLFYREEAALFHFFIAMLVQWTPYKIRGQLI